MTSGTELQRGAELPDAGAVYYADTSALAKLVLAEPETNAMFAWLEVEQPTLATCELTRTELIRAVSRVAPDDVLSANAALDRISIVPVTRATFRHAAEIRPRSLRSLDAVHLAAALDLGDDLRGLLTYDERMADAARSVGIPVLAPA